MADRVVTIDWNPLRISQLDRQLPDNVSHSPFDLALTMLGELVGDRENPFATLRKRYADVSRQGDEVDKVPMHPVIMDHVVRPLKEAKQCYVLGMPIASIAQAGLVGEMVAIWRFEMLQPGVEQRLQDDGVRKITGDKDFEDLGQERRIEVLKLVDDLDDDVKGAFGSLRALRRDYLHFMVKKDTSKIDHDARRALKYANLLVSRTLDTQWSAGGGLKMSPKVMKYIEDILRPSDS